MGSLRGSGGAMLLLLVSGVFVAVGGARPLLAQGEGEAAVISEPRGEATPIEAPTSSQPATASSPQASPEPREAADLDLGEAKQPLGIWRFGGGFGFSFLNDYFFLTIEPQASYLIKRIFEPGATLVYQWSKDKFPDPNVVRHTVGGRLFARVYPIRQLFVLVEGELLNSGVKQGELSGDRENYPNLFLGGGFLFGLGKGAFFSVGIKVNVFTSDLYPDHFPIFSLGAGVGL